MSEQPPAPPPSQPPSPPPAAPPPPPPPAGPPPAYGGGYAVPVPPTNQKALWAMILGIPSVVCCGIFTGVPAIILGVIGRREVQESRGTQKGEGMAIAGIVLGAISIAFTILLFLFWALVIAAATGGARVHRLY